MSGDREKSGNDADVPPNSRLFIVGNKRLTETDYRDSFSRFGEIEDIWVVKNKRTGENTGVTYIKYHKTSEAAAAFEAMNGKSIGDCNRSIKVMVASSRKQGSQREENEDEKIQRLFVIIPKTMKEEALEDYFKQFGDIDYVDIVRDRDTRESKGFAYIKYYKFSHAARAFEECDRSYKAVFSEPRKSNIGRNKYESAEKNGITPIVPVSNPFDENSYRVSIVGSPFLTENVLWKICNIVPGFERCALRMDARQRRTSGHAVFATRDWANWAIEKLDGFEYPPGCRITVMPDIVVPKTDRYRPTNIPPLPGTTNIQQLAETIVQATTLMASKPSGINTDSEPPYVCSVQLPELKPLANIDAAVEARCFIVCTPPPPAATVLRDIFCRFGNLIEVYLLTNKNCGYAKYASKESAEYAIKFLHGAEVCGGRMKVMVAEERSDDHSRKRLRLDDSIKAEN